MKQKIKERGGLKDNGLKKWRGLLFVVPSLMGVSILYIIPFVETIGYCFTTGGIGGKFVGLSHFRTLFHNKAYKLAMKNTTLIIGITIPLLCLLAMVIALFIEENLKKYVFLQGCLLMPIAMPTVSLLLVWKDLFEKEGVLDFILTSQIDYLDSKYAPLIIMGLIIWKNIGYDVLLILSSLLILPKEYEEAAQLDGAGKIKIACLIKIPQLVPMLFFTVIISLFNGFKIFREIYLLKGQYPNESIYLLQHFMNNNFICLNYNRLATSAFMMYLVIFIVIYWTARWQKVIYIVRK
ncbi:MAG: carbohydrate ABC transporter permease [Cellulosilyticaceae bacterium]